MDPGLLKLFDTGGVRPVGELMAYGGPSDGASMAMTAEPTTEPRPVENSTRWLPQAMSSAISALSLMLAKPNMGSPSGTTSSR